VVPQELPGPSALLPIPWWRHDPHAIHPAANGRLFVAGDQVIALEEHRVQMFGVGLRSRFGPLPSANGERVYTEEGFADRWGKPLSKKPGLPPSEVVTIPSLDSEFLVEVTLPSPSRALALTLCNARGEKLFTSMDLAEMNDLYQG